MSEPNKKRAHSTLMTSMFVEEDVPYLTLVSEQDRWSNEIGTELLKVIERMCNKIQEMKEKHTEFEQFAFDYWKRMEDVNRQDEQNAVERIDNRLYETTQSKQNETANAFAEHRKKLGIEYFGSASHQHLTNGFYSFTFRMCMLPDILVPKNAMATIELNDCTDYAKLSLGDGALLSKAILVEIALGTETFEKITEGGERFMNELTRKLRTFISQNFKPSLASNSIVLGPLPSSDQTVALTITTSKGVTHFTRDTGVRINFERYVGSKNVQTHYFSHFIDNDRGVYATARLY